MFKLPLALRSSLTAKDGEIDILAGANFKLEHAFAEANAELASLREQVGVAKVRTISVVQEVNRAMLDPQLSRASQRYLHLIASHLTIGMSLDRHPSEKGGAL